MDSNFITIEGHPNEQVNGRVEFDLPTPYQQVRIDKRMAQMAAPFNFDELPGESRARVRMLSSLEFIVKTAPEGWYKANPKDGKPLLDFSNMKEVDEGTLWAVYAAYRTYRDNGLKSRTGVTYRTGEETGDEADLRGGQEAEPRPALEFGHSERSA